MDRFSKRPALSIASKICCRTRKKPDKTQKSGLILDRTYFDVLHFYSIVGRKPTGGQYFLPTLYNSCIIYKTYIRALARAQPLWPVAPLWQILTLLCSNKCIWTVYQFVYTQNFVTPRDLYIGRWKCRGILLYSTLYSTLDNLWPILQRLVWEK